MRISLILAIAALALGACGSEETIEEENPAELKAQAQAKARAKAKKATRAKAKAEEEALKADPPTATKAHRLAANGKVDEALEMLKDLLKSAPDVAENWQAISRIAIAHGRHETLLAELDAATPIGGQTELHHHLRAELAVAGQNYAQMLLDAAQLINAESVAYFKAIALLEMQENTLNLEGLDPEKATDALLLGIAESNLSKRKKLLKDLDFKSAQLRLYLAQNAQTTGLNDKAVQLFSELAQGEPALATTYSAQLFLWGESTDTDSKAKHAEALTRTAFAAGDSAKGFAHLKQAIADARSNHSAAQAYALSKDILALSEEATPEVLLQAKAFFARTALDNGLPDIALETAKTWAANCKSTQTETQGEGDDAKEVEITNWDQSCLAEPAWIQGVAAFQLGLDKEIIAEGWDAPPPSFSGLSALLKGDNKTAEAALPGKADANRIVFLIAKARAQKAQGKSAISTLRQAIKHADKSGFNPDRVGTRLHLANALFETEARNELGKLLTELDRMASQWGEKGAALKAETRGRRIMAGIRSTGDGSNIPGSSLFSALSTSTEIEAKTDGEHRLAKWARARAAMAKGEDAKAIEAYADAATATPPIFQGPWANLSVLNGRSGPGIEQDLGAILKRSGPDTGILALPLHDWWHEKEMMASAFAIGDDPSVALDRDQRITLNAAHRALQSRTVQWLAGSLAAPTAAESDLDKAHATAMENKSYARGLPGAPMEYAKVPSTLRSKAILSYRMGARTGDAIVVTKTGSRLARLENVGRIRSNATRVRSLLKKGEAHGGLPGLIPGKSAAMPLAVSGDQLRIDLLDIFTAELAGVGIYLLLVDADLYGFSFSIFPEQKDAARFIADIRSMATNHTTRLGLRTSTQGKINYGTDILALSPFRPAPDPKVGSLLVPGEAKNAARLFRQGTLVSKEGEEATAELLTATIDDARFVHISDYTSKERGGIQLAGGSLSLADLRSKDIGAYVSVLSTAEDSRILARQAHALYVSGASNILLSNRLIDEHVRGRFVYNFYEAIARERPPVMALSEARKSLAGDNDHNGYFDPSWWGQFILYGNP
jgi:hypothetical protein